MVANASSGDADADARSDTKGSIVSSPSVPPVEQADPLFAGEGEMARLMRATDWAQSPLGTPQTWSASLRMMAGLLLANRFPLLLWWGPQFYQLYNDAYRPVLGTKHPRSMGQSASECWPEIWDVIGPLIETPFKGGPATWSDDLFLEVHRHGLLEETHFTVAYSPVPDESAPNGIGGVLATVHEIGEQVVGERRVELLRDLGARSGEAKTAEEACQLAAETLTHHAKDIPFALLYLIDADGKQARLAATAGVAAGATISPEVIALEPASTGERESRDDAGQGWPVDAALRGELAQMIDDVSVRFDAVPPGPWADPPRMAVVLPIHSNIAHQPAGVLIAGVSARLRYDDAYAGFLELVSSQIATAVATARAYEEERRRAEALAALDRAKTTFFSNVSHEFRTPLTLMLGPATDSLADARQPLPPDQRERMEVIQRNGLRLLKLVNTLLDFSRIEAGRIRASYEPTDLASFTAELASTFRSLVEAAGMRLVVECAPLPEPVYVDRDMWEKIVLNLLSNAFKFTLQGTITVALHLAPLPEQAGAAMVELEVRDTGVGVPGDELPHLFERFHRVEGMRARTHEGSGIGLALVQELVHLHAGTIQAESRAGEGTRFVVRIPLGVAHLPAEAIVPGDGRTQASTALGAAPFVEEAERWLPNAAWTGTPAAVNPAAVDERGIGDQLRRGAVDEVSAARIVLADDNADMREYLQRLLGERYRVEATVNGQAALAAIERERPDLVLADVMMPELDGFGLLRVLRANPRTATVPVMLLSARAGEEATIEGLAAGADDYLIKPFSAREVLSRIAGRLEIAKSQAEALVRARELEATFEAMVDGVAIYDAEGRILRLNPALRHLLALDDEYTRRSVEERVPRLLLREADGLPLPAARTPPVRVARGEIFTGSSSMDILVCALDGREVEVNVSGAPVRDSVGRIVGGVCVYRDVTERRALERRTAESLEALLAMAEAMVGTVRPSAPLAAPGDISSEGRLNGQPALTMIVERLAILCCRVLNSERVAIIDLDPETELLRPLALTGAPSEQEKLWRAGMLRTRLADRFGAEQSARLRAGESVFIEVDGLGRDDPARILSNRCFLLVPMFAGGTLAGYFGVNFGDRRSDYTPEGIARAQAVAQLVGLVVERERLTIEREEAQASARAQREATRRMDEFLGIASHELRTPLTSITANVQMAERLLRPARRGGGEPEESHEPRADGPRSDAAQERAHMLLERTERQVVRLDRLVGDLLDVSRIQADKLELRRELVDLVAIVREATEAQRAVWALRSVTLDLPRVAQGIRVLADADRIGQVVTNYLTNALKYSQAQQPVDVRVRVEEANPTVPSPARGGNPFSPVGTHPRQSAPPSTGEGGGGGVVRVEVSDHGPGLSPEQREHLFERFYRVPGIGQQSGSGVGLGLGLHICKTIVARHGGQVGVESAPGEGSTFWFMLPLATQAT